jgi:predicted short-subunit dehydrogenase-like oxidoreductase (DUF2520 family)
LALTEKSFIRIVLVGSGNVAWHLGHAFRNNGIEIVQVINRSSRPGKELAHALGSTYSSYLQKKLPVNDFVVVAVKDSALKEVLHSIQPTNAIVLHTSGTFGIDIFPLGQKNYGILYPIQTLTKGVYLDLRQTPLVIEASDKKSLSQIKELAEKISGNVREVSTEHRRVLHVSGIFLNNFTNHLIACTFDYMKKYKLDQAIVLPLLEETICKLKKISPYEAQTGPARRNDLNIIHRHLEFLSNEPQLQKLYSCLTDSIIMYYSKNDKSI